MDEAIKKAVNAVKKIFAGFSLVEQASMFDMAAASLLEEMDECLEREYNMKDFFGETE